MFVTFVTYQAQEKDLKKAAQEKAAEAMREAKAKNAALANATLEEQVCNSDLRISASYLLLVATTAG